jgi:competence protein ComEC
VTVEAAPCAVVAFLVAGIAIGERAGPNAAVGLLIGAAALSFAALLLPFSRARAAVMLLVVALAGVALTQRALDGLVHSPLASAISGRADATIEATLAEDPDGTRFSTRVLVRVHRARVGKADWRDAGGRTVMVEADAEAASRLAVLSAGDRVALGGWFSPLQGFDERFRWRHAVGRFSANRLLGFHPPAGPLMPLANTVRDTALHGTRFLAPDERALVSGFLVGDARNLPDTVVEQFRASGLSHLLVVSGENVAFVLALLSPVTRRLPRRTRVVAGFAALVLFGAMTRWEPSVLRACVMAACAMTAVHVGRPAPALRTLAFACTALLAIDPFLVHSIGFLLSCGACLGIALLAPVIAARLPGPVWLREIVAVSAAAQIGVAPVLLPVFGSLPLISLPANLLAVPIAAPLTTWGLAASTGGGLVAPIAPGLARLVQLPTGVLADAVLGIADAAARVPLVLDTRSAVVVGAVVAIAAIRRRPRMLRRDALVVPPR